MAHNQAPIDLPTTTSTNTHALAKKICMIGGFAVGKTSLVARFVKSIFSDKYLTTVGVKIDKKEVDVDGRPVSLLIWDLAGEDEMNSINLGYVRGSFGCILVADGTRAHTLDQAIRLRGEVEKIAGPIPVLLLLNKADLAHDWEITPADLARLRAEDWHILETSALTGHNVEEAFSHLARRMMPPP